jgi:pimeloyl-ACP methyl ester carboxylesterase
MADSLQVVDVTPLTRPVRFATREALYAASASTLYLSGASDAVSSVLAKPLPRFLRRNRTHVKHPDRRLPVLLLHGLGHNQSWSYKLQRRLTDDGFASRSVNYHTFSRRLNDCADIVAEHIWEFTGRSAAPAVHVVAHSIGGLVLRAAINRHPEIQDYVATGITIGSPHRGTPWAYGPGAVVPLVGHLVRELRPGSSTLKQIDNETVAGSTQWVSMYSVSDEIVPMYYGRLEHPALEIQQVEYRGLGHYGLMYHPAVLGSVLASLADSDTKFAQAWDANFHAA